ncbi:MAG: S9 family peptidase [Actinomycetota bacterium]
MEGMRPERIYDLPVLTDPRLSPDGRLAAFVVTETVREKNDYRSSIWMVPTDGSDAPARLTSGNKIDVLPRWSPDGTRIAFLSNREGDAHQLYAIRIDGGEPVKLTDLEQGAGSHSWSPDGEQLAFTSVVPGPDYEKEEKDRPARRITRLRFRAEGAGWTSDRFSHVFVVRADGDSERDQITSGDFQNQDPVWSPDGSRLAFVSSRDPDWDLKLGNGIFVVEVENKKVSRLTSGAAQHSQLSWSPDGALIACRFTINPDELPANAHVAVVDVESGRVNVLTRELDRNCAPTFNGREPIWRGGTVLFPVEIGGNIDLYEAAADGGTVEPVLQGERAITGHDARGEVVVHLETTAVQPPELYLAEKRLTHFTKGFTDSTALAEAERFQANSTSGEKIDAWMMRPVGFEPGRRYPVLLMIHGGPFVQYENSFAIDFQVAAASGYVVLYCNPRGSSGYPEEWGRAIRGPYEVGPGLGTVDYEDVMAVVDEALARFDFCDGERMGVTGGSYGGYLTAWVVTQTDRFKAACAERGMYNLVSVMGKSDNTPMGWITHWGRLPYDDLEPLMQHSPVAHAHKVTTPLLLIHGDQDFRAPVEQAEELFGALRAMRKEVELLRFPLGNHGFGRGGLPSYRVERLQAIIEWFDRYLKP